MTLETKICIFMFVFWLSFPLISEVKADDVPILVMSAWGAWGLATVVFTFLIWARP